ncbi:MAG: FG-GAP-like repeat-containing protein [Anaerolineaceae bacterium]|nr:FG-GAP-like repeat-containing protein [Anaerolineaceae bacterium]
MIIRLFLVSSLCLFGILATLPADAGVDKSGVKPQVLSLPKGPGSIEGLGESFEPQLNTGTVAYAVKLTVPPGRAGLEPELILRYNGGNANGPFGLGWLISMKRVQRQTDKGLPDYEDTDTFIESGGEELVPVGQGVYRCENESSFVRYTQTGEGWTATDRSGVVYKFGLISDSQIRNGSKVFRWLLQEMIDTNGNYIRYDHNLLDSGPQRYLTRIVYNENGADKSEIIFEYETRTDALADYRPTFRLETAFRCKSISIKSSGILVRRYNLAYIAGSDISLLESITQFGADGASSLPPARFTYTGFDPNAAEVVTMCGKDDESLPPGLILSTEPDATLNDMNADGLPDLLIAKPRDHQVYFNLGVGNDGKHRWGVWTEMGQSLSPDEALGNDGASLADIDGDGKTDFIARRSVDTYFIWRNPGTGVWGPTETFADNSGLPFDFENAAVRLLDVNNDKHIDVMYCEDRDGEFYRYYLNNGQEYTVHYGEGLGNAMTFDQRPGMKLADMNGDRLQDIVLLQNGYCVYWPSSGVAAWDKTRRGDWGGSEIGTGTKMFNPPDSEADGEPGLEYDWPDLKLVDINGDGLTDVLYVLEGATRIVYWLNSDSIRFKGPFQVDDVPVKIGLSLVQMADINGNGTTDVLWNYPEDSDINPSKIWQYLEMCPSEKPYLLKTATNGIGQTTTFFYRSSVEEYVRDRPVHPWPAGVPISVPVLGAFHVEDGRGGLYCTEFQYHDGYYEGKEKEFRGFAAVEKIEKGSAEQGAPSLVTAYEYHTGATVEALKGKLLALEAQTKSGEVFFHEENAWTTCVLAEGTGNDTREVTFPYQSAKTRDVLEKGNGTLVQLKWEYEYDNYGNMTRQIEHGRMDSGWDDERVIETSYTAGYPSGLSNWILDKVVESSATDESGALAAHQRNYYDENSALGEVSKGNLTHVEDWVAGGEYIVSVRNDYDAYGNIIAIYDPLYGAQPGHYREFVYDKTYHTFPVQERIHTGLLTLTMSATYDPGWGVMKTSTDFNGFTTHYAYDTFGRLTSITKPPDTGHTVEYDYVLAHQLGGGKLINWVETRQRDGSSGDGFLHSRMFYDGLGRNIMTRAEGEGSGQIVVTDTVQFNARKKPWKKYLPYFKTGTLDFVEPTFNSGFSEHFYDALGREIRINQPVGPEGIVYSTTTYEPLAKTIRDENQTDPASGHAGCAMQYVEDGLLDEDGKGRLREVYEIVKLSDTGETLSAPVEWKTTYSYDLLGNLTGYTDSQNNQKIIEYDGLGRKTFMNDPDRGHMNYAYDAASNLIRTVDAKEQIIEYSYDGVNRLTAEFYGKGKTEPDVEYHYDMPFGPVDRGYLWQRNRAQAIADFILQDEENFLPEYDLNNDGKVDVADIVKAEHDPTQDNTITAENTLGFLSWVSDQSGEEHNSFDTRGRVKWVVKRIIDTSPNDLRNFYTAMEYDSMDRIAKLTYPDQTYVNYPYNSRGLLESVSNVIDRYDYNPAGQNAVLELACGTVTTYDYDHRLRLSRLHTVRSRDALTLQDLNYTFDGVSNIKHIEDGRNDSVLDKIGMELGIESAEARKFNGTQFFAYDSLYRLTQASNTSVYGTIDYRYDRISNMIRKNASLNEPDPLMDLGEMTSGGSKEGSWNRIGRDPGTAPGPHALTGSEKGPNGTRDFSYDYNGNMISERDLNLTWDYKDRLAELVNVTNTAQYIYDYTNTRKKKIVADTANGSIKEAFYIDKFSEVREGKLIKYVYEGNNRVARSNIVASKSSGFQPSSFYPHDHLGSTNLTLAVDATVTEQLVNYPFGHARKEIYTPSQPCASNYKFTGKERDDESGLQYFEARYLVGHIGRFASVDSLYSEVVSLDEEKFQRFLKNPQEMNFYVYAQNDPIKFNDPSGSTVRKAFQNILQVLGKMLTKISKEASFVDTFRETTNIQIEAKGMLCKSFNMENRSLVMKNDNIFGMPTIELKRQSVLFSPDQVRKNLIAEKQGKLDHLSFKQLEADRQFEAFQKMGVTNISRSQEYEHRANEIEQLTKQTDQLESTPGSQSISKP